MTERPLTVIAILVLVILVVGGAVASSARAQSLNLTSGGDDGGPIDIVAEDGIEWQQSNSVFLARGNARAIRGEVEVNADILKAYYRDSDGPSQIWRLDAEGSVTIESPSEKVTGDLAIYDVQNGVLVVRGRDVRFIAGADTITADEQLEYWESKQLAVARGNATAVREDKRLNARVLAAYFRRVADGKTDVDRIEAFDDVTITTATERITASRGVYTVATGIVTLTGNVRVTRDGNTVEGCNAEVDLNTNISRMFACKNGSKRVTGSFIPSKKPDLSDTADE